MRKLFWALSATIYTIILTALSLMPLGNIPDVGVSYGDKIFHFLAYFVLTFLWVFTVLYNFKFKINKSIGIAFFISVAFGMLIEVLQGALTAARSFDFYDMLANTLGALLASAVLGFYNLKTIKKL